MRPWRNETWPVAPDRRGCRHPFRRSREASGDPNAKKAPIQECRCSVCKAFNAGDAATIAALYSRDAIFMMPEEPAYKGTKGVRAVAQAGLDAGWRNIKFKTIKSGSDGDLAFNVGSVSMDQPSDGGMIKVKGKYLDVYQRQKDGSWKIIATSYNTDKPAK